MDSLDGRHVTYNKQNKKIFCLSLILFIITNSGCVSSYKKPLKLCEEQLIPEYSGFNELKVAGRTVEYNPEIMELITTFPDSKDKYISYENSRTSTIILSGIAVGFTIGGFFTIIASQISPAIPYKEICI